MTPSRPSERVIASALFLAIVVLAFAAGRASALRPAQAIPASVGVDSAPIVPAESRTPERTGAPIDPAVAQPAERHRDRNPAVQATGSNPVRGANVGAPPRGHSLAGVASWYCGQGDGCTAGYPPSCACAAASARLRGVLGSGWRGRGVTVCAAARCLTVRLVDACGCPGGRLIDLYSSVFRQLAPLVAGLVKVRVAW